MDRRKIFERLLMSSLAEILTHLVTMTRESPRPGYAQRDLDQRWVQLESLGFGNIAQVPGNRPKVGQNHAARSPVSATF